MSGRIRILFFWACLLACEQGHSKAVVEVAPLKAALGFPSVRGEYSKTSHFSYGLIVEANSRPSERFDRTDRSKKIGVDYIWYPQKKEAPGVMLLMGVRYERATVGHRQERNYVSDIKYDYDDRFDYWTSEEDRVSIVTSIGYRFKWARLFTLSFRYIFDQMALDTQRIVDRDLKTESFDPKKESRHTIEHYAAMYVGINIE